MQPMRPVRNHRMWLRMDAVDLAILDEARGEVNRSEWIRRLIRGKAQPRIIVVEREPASVPDVPS
jgi:hypothetical protein